jgi:hypothetical protein
MSGMVAKAAKTGELSDMAAATPDYFSTLTIPKGDRIRRDQAQPPDPA